MIFFFQFSATNCGVWYDADNYLLSGNNNDNVDNVANLDACKALCEATTAFTCVSVDYGKIGGTHVGGCWMSEENQNTQSGDFGLNPNFIHSRLDTEDCSK